MKSTHRITASSEESNDSVRVERADTGCVVITVNQAQNLGLNKRTMLFLSQSTFEMLCLTSLTFQNDEGACALPEDLDVEF